MSDLETVFKKLSTITVNSPFEKPESNDILGTANACFSKFKTLSTKDRDVLRKKFTNYEARSLLARLGATCAEALNKKDPNYLHAAIMLYDLGSSNNDYRENIIKMAIFYNAETELNVKPQLSFYNQLSPTFHKDYTDFAEREGSLKELSSFHLKLDYNGKVYKYKAISL